MPKTMTDLPSVCPHRAFHLTLGYAIFRLSRRNSGTVGKGERTVRKALLIACFLLAPAFQGFSQEAEKRPMTVDDALDMVRVGDALISPDGEWVFFSKSELDWEKNKRKSTYFRIPATGGEAYRFIGEAGGSAFQFSPKGTYLSFLREAGGEAKEEEKSKENQIFVMRSEGGEAVQLTEHKKGIHSYRWSRDESRIFFLADEPRSEEEEKKYKDGYDAIFVDEGPNGQREGKWRKLWMFDVKSKEETRLTDDDIIIGSYDVSPDGGRVVFTARSENRRNQQYLSEIYLIRVEEKLVTRLTENRAPEDDVRFAPDGHNISFSAPDDKEWELRNSKIWIMNPETREYGIVSDGFDGNIRDYFWTPDSKSLLFTGLVRTDSNLFKLDIESKKVTPMTEGDGLLMVSSFSKDRSKYVFTRQDCDSPPDLYVGSLGGGEPVRLTEANPWIEKDLLLATCEVIRWKSKDGLEIEGMLDLPAGYKKGTSIPLMLNIHGGPAGVFTKRFDPDYHIYAGLGYASLSPNVRGSSGYSDDLLRGNMRDIGGGDFQDLMTGVDYVIEQGYADPDRLALRGWSYGGILGGWTITQTDRFKAASIGAMVSNWVSEYGPGFNHDVHLWYIGGTPWENPDAWRQKSSLTHVANVTTPTIILHGIDDITDTEPQSMMFFTALKDMGKEVRYIRFPREPHGFREPRHQRTRDIEEIRWMQKYVLGEDWEPWERRGEKDEEKKSPDKPTQPE
jgi:dipeptidyl aminopeptidase/acylaminoacyl peptidase